MAWPVVFTLKWSSSNGNYAYLKSDVWIVGAASVSVAFFARSHVWRVEPVQHRRGVSVRQDFENYWNRRQERARPPKRNFFVKHHMKMIKNLVKYLGGSIHL